MAQHRVVLHAPAIKVVNADYEFEVIREGQKFGRLRISKGGLVFMPKKKSGKKYSKKRIGWTELDEYARHRK